MPYGREEGRRCIEMRIDEIRDPVDRTVVYDVEVAIEFYQYYDESTRAYETTGEEIIDLVVYRSVFDSDFYETIQYDMIAMNDFFYGDSLNKRAKDTILDAIWREFSEKWYIGGVEC